MTLSKRTLLVLSIVAIAVFFLMKERHTPETTTTNYYHERGIIFGTVYNITYSHNDSVNLLPQIKSALNSVDYSLSMFNPNSTISKVNNNDTTVTLDPLFLQVLERSMQVSILTDGAFDITVAPLVDLWGFGLKERETVDSTNVKDIMNLIGYHKITLTNGAIMKQHPSMRLDASAIAKGFACDVVADTLQTYGCESFCVEIGGEIVVHGTNSSGKAWRVGINKPTEDTLAVVNEIHEVVEMNDGAMATSGNYRNFYINNGKKVSHTIDPLTGFPVVHSLLSATIITEDCTTADALATACMVMGLEKSIKTIETLDSTHAYFIYSENGKLQTWKSSNFPIQD